MNTTNAYRFRKALSAITANTTYSAKVPTTTKPATSATLGQAIIDLFDPAYGLSPNTFVPKYIHLVPYGSDANNETINMRLYGWTRTNDATPVWVPQLLLDLAMTLGNISATALEAGCFMVDTITLTSAPDEATEISPTNELPGNILTHIRGCELLEIEFDVGTGAGANCLWRVMDER